MFRAGTYRLRLYYALGGDPSGRASASVQLGAYGGAAHAQRVHLPPTGGWAVLGSVNVTVTLQPGRGALWVRDHDGAFYARLELTRLASPASWRPRRPGAYMHALALSLANGAFEGAGAAHGCTTYFV